MPRCYSRRTAAGGGEDRGRVRLWTGLIAVAIATLVPGHAGTSVTAAAPPASSAAELSVEIGADGFVEAGDSFLVRVDVSANELIDGELFASLAASPTTFRTDIEVAAGTTKRYAFVLPLWWDAPRVTVSVTDGGEQLASETVSARAGQAEIVGVLPRLAARFDELPDTAALADGLGSARLTVFDLELLDLGVAALQTFDTLIVSGDDLTGLDDGQLADVLRWVSIGGVLVVDDEAGLAALPDEWQPGTNGAAWAGLGEIRHVKGAASAGAWGPVISPTTTGSIGNMVGTEMMSDTQFDLANRSGVDLPSITPLAIGLGIYAVVLGPGVYFALRKWRRLTLGWVVIPALAVLTAGGIAVAGDGVFRQGDPAATVFVQTTPGGAYELASALTYSSNGGVSRQVLPAGWNVLAGGNMFGPPDMSSTMLEPTAGGVLTSSVRLEAMQANVRSYEGPAPELDLEVTAEFTTDGDGGGTISGTVTNRTGRDLVDVAVFAGNANRKIGELADGDTAEWEVRAPRTLQFDFQSRGAAVWGQPWDNMGNPVVRNTDEAGAEYGIWGLASMRFDLFPGGMARVVGWTGNFDTGLFDGESSTVAAVSALAPITSDVAGAATVRAILVRHPWMGGGAGTDQMIRYLLPPDASTEELVITGMEDVDVEELAAWDGRQWFDLAIDDDVAALPESAVRQGSVLIRTDIDMNSGTIGYPTLTSATLVDS
jgi:hypothetical protein